MINKVTVWNEGKNIIIIENIPIVVSTALTDTIKSLPIQADIRRIKMALNIREGFIYYRSIFKEKIFVGQTERRKKYNSIWKLIN